LFDKVWLEKTEEQRDPRQLFVLGLRPTTPTNSMNASWRDGQSLGQQK
jgi:hypothetical protein